MLRRVISIACTLFGLVLASCGGNVATTALPTAIQSSTGATTFALTAALRTTQLTVSEPGYHGSFTARSSNTAIVMVAPATLQSSATARTAEAKIEASADGRATFTLTAIQNGSATISVTDDLQHASAFGVAVSGFPSPPSSTPTAAPVPSPTASPGPLSVSPVSLSFNGTGQVQSVTVTDPGTTAIAASGCAAIATLGAVASGSFTVTAVAAGSCTITVSDSFTHTATIAVGVTTLGVPVQ